MFEWNIAILIFDVENQNIGTINLTRWFATQQEAEAFGQKEAVQEMKRWQHADWWYVKVS